MELGQHMSEPSSKGDFCKLHENSSQYSKITSCFHPEMNEKIASEVGEPISIITKSALIQKMLSF